MINRESAPLWVKIMAIVLALPAFTTPSLLANCVAEPAIVRTMVMIYPAYVVVSAWLGVVCWPQRRTMSWILFVLMVLTHIAIYFLSKWPG